MHRPVDNPPNPWDRFSVDYLGEPPPARLVVYEETARSIIATNESPDLDFRHTINPYRGCVHACAYCYARPTHQYIGFGAGTDFDRKIVAKLNAPELLRRELERPSWRGDTLVFSGVTDCYQALEASYELTRRCLEVCLDFAQPVSIITKGALVARDAGLLAELARKARACVYFSIAFSEEDAAALEPWAPKPARRYAAMRCLTDAGVETGVSLAPIIPGLNDAAIPKLLSRARDAGATRAFMTLVRLPGEVLPVFDARLAEVLPLRADKVRRAIRELRRGALNDASFGSRMVGAGPRWHAIESLFRCHAEQLGLDVAGHPALPTTFRRPEPQGSLFDLGAGAPRPAGSPRPASVK